MAGGPDLTIGSLELPISGSSGVDMTEPRVHEPFFAEAVG